MIAIVASLIFNLKIQQMQLIHYKEVTNQWQNHFQTPFWSHTIYKEKGLLARNTL